jgi:hypothetical protein
MPRAAPVTIARLSGSPANIDCTRSVIIIDHYDRGHWPDQVII